MKLEDQVCTLEQAKMLKELGVRCDDRNLFASLFFWSDEGRPNETDYQIRYGRFVQSRGGTQHPYYSAFTVAELGVMLPVGFQWSTPHYERWICCEEISGYEGATAGAQAWGDNEAQARAAMLIYLLESGNITSSEVNDRLTA